MAKSSYHPPVDSTAPSTDPVDSPPVVADSHSSASVPVTRTPEKWAEVYFPVSGKGRLHDDAWKHAAAAQMHGWNAYVARSGKTVELSESAYKAALDAVAGNETKPAVEADYRNRS